MKEIERVKGFDGGTIACRRCGRKLHLYFNGGELDCRGCCGLLYKTESVRTDLVIYDLDQTVNTVQSTTSPADNG